MDFNDLVNKYKGLLSSAGGTLSNFFPPVQAYKAVKHMASPQYGQQVKQSVNLLSQSAQKFGQTYLKSPQGEVLPQATWKKPQAEQQKIWSEFFRGSMFGATTAPQAIAGLTTQMARSILKVKKGATTQQINTAWRNQLKTKAPRTLEQIAKRYNTNVSRILNEAKEVLTKDKSLDWLFRKGQTVKVSPYKGQIGELERKMDELIGFRPTETKTLSGVKAQYGERIGLIEMAKEQAPPKIVKQIEKIESQLNQLRTARLTQEEIRAGLKKIKPLTQATKGVKGKTFIHETNVLDIDKFDLSKAGTGQGEAWLGKGIYLQEEGVFKFETYGKNKVKATLSPKAKVFEVIDTPRGKYRDNFVEWAVDKGFAKNLVVERTKEGLTLKNILPRDILRRNPDVVAKLRKEGFDALFQDGELVVYNPKVLNITQATKGVKGIKVKPLKVSKVGQIRQAPPSPLSPLSEILEGQKQPKSVLQEATLKQSKQPTAKALPDIISKEPISVKEKVGVLDYFRTPDRVLKKIGLEKEANLLRSKYDDYLKQLPQEIDKVTEWSKQLPKESNQRIFKYLDGQEIQLSKQELKVAGEIKTYLKSWADKLGLPEEKRITNYITHIFEKDFIKKEFDPDLAKLIQNKVPGSVYDPFTEKRLGKTGYIEDTWRALDAYVKRATRKVNMDVALKEVKKASRNLELSQFNYVKKYIARINLRPTELDNLMDNTIKQLVGYRLGQRPVAAFTRTARQMVYRGTLGLNPGVALKNLMQGANTYAKLGEKWTIKGYWDLLTKGTKELDNTSVMMDRFIQDRTMSVGKQMSQKIDKGLFVFFDGAEKILRGAAYYGTKARAIFRGATEEEAILEGLKMVRDTQFTFGSIDTPVALQSDIAKLLAQFQTYTLKQTEFLGEMLKNKEFAGLFRYLLASTLMIGTVGKAIGMDFKDMIPTFRIGLPPTLQTPVEIGKAVLGAPDKYGNIPDIEQRLKNVGRSLIPFLPGGTQGRKTLQGIEATERGYSETPSGRVRFPVGTDPASKVRGALFGQYNFPEARRYYDEDLSPLGEKQSEKFRESLDPIEFYESIIQKRKDKESKKTSSVDEVVAAGELPTNPLDLEVLYDDAQRTISGYAVNAAKIRTGLKDTQTLPEAQKELVDAKNVLRRIEEEQPELVYGFELDTFKSGGSATVEERADWVVKKLGEAQDQSQHDSWLQGMLDEKVITRSVLDKIREAGLDINQYNEAGEIKTLTGRKPKKITLRKVKVPKIKLAKIKKVTVKRPTKKVKRWKLTKAKVLKSTVTPTKLTKWTPKVSKKDTSVKTSARLT